MSKWTSKNAILRDLSEAQGCEVPVDIVNAVADGEKPPTPNFVEETEEEYFEHCTGAGDAPHIPDFGLIRQMLNIVQLSNTIKDDDDENKALSENLMLQTDIAKGVNVRKLAKKTNTKKINHNAAVESIQQSIGKEIVDGNQVKKDIIFKSEDCRVIDNNILPKTLNINASDVNSRQNSPGYTRPFALEPVNMFRKKSPNKKTAIKDEEKKFLEKNYNVETYKPSELASEYYKKYVERSQVQEAMKDDIWTRAEKKMKEIEEKKKLQVSQSTPASSNNFEMDVAKIWEEINLLRHRHLLTEDCIVCTVFSQHGYHIDVTE